MFQIEKRIIEWANRYMVYIALGFVAATALWTRLGGRNFVGSDYHYSLYDIPGNCNSLLYRSLAGILMRRPDSAVALLKMTAYAGDFAAAALALALSRREHQKLGDLRTFFTLTAFLLSPVALIYSVGGMEIDSVCMSLLLAGILLLGRGLALPAVPVAALAAFLYPAYWPITAAFWAYMILSRKKSGRSTPTMATAPKTLTATQNRAAAPKTPTAAPKTSAAAPNPTALQTALAAALMTFCVILSVFLENHGGGGYFWGKIFVVNPATGESYAGLIQWLLGMCKIYGYFFAMGTLLLCFKYRKLRIPALILQILVIMYVGWQQTSFLAV